MMNCYQNKTVGQCPQRKRNTIGIVITIVAFSWLSAHSEDSHAQRQRVYRGGAGQVAGKPLSPFSGSRANEPMILSIKNTWSEREKNHSVIITCRDFHAKEPRKLFELERQLVGASAWHTVFTKKVNDQRIPSTPSVRDRRRQPGAKFAFRDTRGLVAGKKYRYRLRLTIPSRPRPIVLLSAVRSITVRSARNPRSTFPR